MLVSAHPLHSALIATMAVGFGAAFGALLRWALSAWLNPLHEGVPPGTLTANLIGGFLAGVTVAWLAKHPDISPAWRLFAITGFLGGLTTFSTFSLEVVQLLQSGRFATATFSMLSHLVGSIAATFIGMKSASLLD
jgi:CrcB protein